MTHRGLSALYSLFPLILILVLAGCSDGTPARTSAGNNTVVPPIEVVEPDPEAIQTAPGLLVKYKPSVSMTASLEPYNLTSMETFPLIPNLAFVEMGTSDDTARLQSELAANPDVEYVEPNYIVNVFQVFPNDPRFASQTALHNVGQNGRVVDADVDAVEGWTIEQGADVVIAVIDSGVDFNHPELKNNILSNAGEIANNSIDDDGNGFIDDVRGWDFANNDNDPNDDNNHGTHVAGIIAAEANNSTGIAGVNWRAKIMPLKFIRADGGGTTLNAIRAIQYAITMKVRLSNSSWGGTAFSLALRDAIANANNDGHLFVASAGNSAADNDVTPTYPASFGLPNIISVAATDNQNELALFSNYGASSVHVAAPGVAVISTVSNGGFAFLSGTSMAAPFVTGVAGLIWSKTPDFSLTQVRTAIFNSVDRFPALSGRIATGGRINAFAALGGTLASLNIIINPRQLNVAVGGTIAFTANGGTAPYTWQVSNPTVAGIDSVSGVLTAVAPGFTYIRVLDANNLSVQQPLAIRILRVAPTTANVALGQSVQFVATDGVAPYRWSVSNGTTATLDVTTGVLRSLAAGNVIVTAIDSNGATASTGTISVVDSAAVTVRVSNPLVGVGKTITATASGGISPHTWATSDPTVATVNNVGLTTGVAPGLFTVTATDATGVMGSSDMLSVVQVTVTTPDNAVLVGSNVQLNVTGGTPPFAWSVNTPNVATISSTGLLTALNPGTVVATASDVNGITGQSELITVVTPAVITIAPANPKIHEKRKKRFTATGGSPPYTWSVVKTKPAIGVIDPVGGVFKAAPVSPATGTVIVTDVFGNTAQTKVTITPPP